MRREDRGDMSVRARAGLAAAVLAVAGAVAPASAAAQAYDSSVGWGGGYISFAPFVEQGEHSPRDIGMGAAWVAMLQGESWQLDRWLGLRLAGFYSNATVAFPTADRSTSAYGLEAAALVRVVPPVAGRAASAYLIGGGGMLWFGLGGGGVVPIAGTDVIYDDRHRNQPMAMGGGGIEVMTGARMLDGGIGVRIEAVDQVTFRSPLRPADGQASGAMHNLRLSVTLFSGLPGLF
jgi:hypothetical protein